MKIDMTKKIDVFGVGNALVDTLVFVDDKFLKKTGMNKGVMTLADGEQQAVILNMLQDHSLELRSGGSAANSMWSISRCGGNAAYASVVSDDPNGEFYRNDLVKNNVMFTSEPLPESEGPTGTCIVLTTPDAERTMSTHLGVSVKMDKEFIHLETLQDSKFIYVEGYLWDSAKSKEACMYALEVAANHGVCRSFTFSDPFCVNRSRDEFENLIRNHCDIVFCNAQEVSAFARKNSLEEAISYVGEMVELAFITNSAAGCIVMQNGKQQLVPGFPVKAIDTNGAGDAFAGGVLHALSQGKTAIQAAKWGNYGARLLNDFRSHFAQILGD